MRTQAAKSILALTLSAAMTLAFSTASVAKPRPSVERVTKAYKVWLAEEGHDLTDRVRIVLKADQIVVHIAHEDGKTRLIFSSDGSTLLGEMSTATDRTAAAQTCLLRFRCNDDDRRSTTEIQVAKVEKPKSGPAEDESESTEEDNSGKGNSGKGSANSGKSDNGPAEKPEKAEAAAEMGADGKGNNGKGPDKPENSRSQRGK